MTVSSIIAEPMDVHHLYPKKEKEEKVLEIMGTVGLVKILKQ
jgi:ABC-type glutathione transport system ATPase component